MLQGTGRERGPAGRPALTRRSRAVWGPALPSRYPGPAAEPPCGADVLGRGHEQSPWPQQAAGPWPPPCPALLLRVGLAGPWAARLACSAAPGLHSVQDVASGLTGCAVATQGPHFTPEPWLWSRRCMGPRHTWGPGHRWAGCEEDRGAPGRHCSGPHRAAARTGPAPRPMRAVRQQPAVRALEMQRGPSSRHLPPCEAAHSPSHQGPGLHTQRLWPHRPGVRPGAGSLKREAPGPRGRSGAEACGLEQSQSPRRDERTRLQSCGGFVPTPHPPSPCSLFQIFLPDK